VAGLIALVAWWFALRLLGRLRGDRDSRLCFVPCVFLLWVLGGFILIMRAPGACDLATRNFKLRHGRKGC